MYKKRIITLSLAVIIIGIASATIYYGRNLDNSTKNKVVTVANKIGSNSKNQNTLGKLSDKEAVEIATKAMEDYMGYSASEFTYTSVKRIGITEARGATLYLAETYSDIYTKEDTKIMRENQNKITDVVLEVQFSFVNKAIPGNLVQIDEKTREITVVDASNNIDKSLKGKIDEVKVSNAIKSFFKKIGKEISYKNARVSKSMENGTINVMCNLSDGRNVYLGVYIKDYSIVSYSLNNFNFKIPPTYEKQLMKITKELKIR